MVKMAVVGGSLVIPGLLVQLLLVPLLGHGGVPLVLGVHLPLALPGLTDPPFLFLSR